MSDVSTVWFWVLYDYIVEFSFLFLVWVLYMINGEIGFLVFWFLRFFGVSARIRVDGALFTVRSALQARRARPVNIVVARGVGR